MLGAPIIRGKAAESIGGFDMVLWDHENDPEYTLICYPVAKFSSDSYFGPQRGETFCLPLNVGREWKIIWSQLVTGKVTLPELHKYFHEPVKHAHALGMEV